MLPRLKRLGDSWLFPLGFLAMFMLTIIVTARLASQIGQPFEGYFIGFGDNGWRKISQQTPAWWPSLRAHGIQVGDHLIDINGVGYDQNVWQNGALGPVGSLAILRVKRDEVVVTLQIPIVAFSTWHFIEARLPMLIVSGCLLLMAIEVWRTQPDKPINQRIALLLGLMAVSFNSDYPSLFYAYDDYWMLSWRLNLLVSVECWLLVTLIYEEVTPRTRLSVWVRWLYGIMVIVRILCEVLAMLGLKTNFDLATTGWNIFYVIFAIFPILLLLRLVWFFWYSQHRPELIQKRNLALALIIGFGANLPLPLLMGITNLFWEEANFFFSYLEVRYLWLFPAMMLANVLIRYQLYGLQNVRLMLVPIITVAAFASSFASTIWWLRMPRTVDEYIVSPFTDFFVFFIGVSVVWITQVSWRGYFGRKFYTERNTFQDVTSYGTRLLEALHKVKSPEQAITQTLYDQYQLSSILLWRRLETSSNAQSTETNYQCVSQRRRTGIALTPPPAIFETMSGLSQVIRLTEDLYDDYPALRRIGGSEGTVAVPLIFEDEIIGWVGLGMRRDGDIWREQDLQGLAIIGQQSAMLLTAFSLESTLEHKNNLLHDTVQQFLDILKKYMPDLVQTLPDSPYKNQLNYLLFLLDEETQGVRNIISGHFDKTLADIERQLVSYRTHVRPIIWNWSDAQPSRELQIYLYQWIKASLHNIHKHSQATQACVILTDDIETQSHVLQISDNGSGFAPQDHASHRIGGLDRIKQTVENMGGSMDVASHEGTTITIHVPLNWPSNQRQPYEI